MNILDELCYENEFLLSYFKQFNKYIEGTVLFYDCLNGAFSNLYYSLNKNVEGLCFEEDEYNYALSRNNSIVYYNNISNINKKYNGVIITSLNHFYIDKIYDLLDNDGYLLIASIYDEDAIHSLYKKFSLVEELVNDNKWIFNIYKKAL